MDVSALTPSCISIKKFTSIENISHLRKIMPCAPLHLRNHFYWKIINNVYHKIKWLPFYVRYIEEILFILRNLERVLERFSNMPIKMNQNQKDRVFANDPGEQDSIPGRVIPKTQNMVLDAALLNTRHYMVRIKSKVEQSREFSCAFPSV